MTVGIGGGETIASEVGSQLRSSGSTVVVTAFRDPDELVSALKEKTVDAAVRGSLSSLSAMAELKQAYRKKNVMRAAILEDSCGKSFVLAPVGIDEGRTRASRKALAIATLDYFARIGITLRVGVLSKGRLEDSSRGRDIARSIADSEELAADLMNAGNFAKHYGILVEDAIKECDLIVPPDGVSGNLMFRTLHFVGGRRAFGAPVVNIPRIFVDTSRAKAGFSESVLLAAGLAKVRDRA